MKKKFLALAMASAVMLTGAGYAAWTDQLHVNSTVSTGELNVHFVGPENPGGSNYYASPRMYYASNNPWMQEWQWNSALPDEKLTSSVTWGEKNMTFEFGNMYPGTRACGLYTFENDGTIPAVIQDVTVTSRTTVEGDNGPEVLPQIRVTHSWLQIERDGQVADGDKLYVADIPLAQLEDTLEGFFVGKRLQPGDKVILGDKVVIENTDKSADTFNFELPLDSLSGDQGENETIQIDIQFDFVQHNGFDSTAVK